VTAGTKARRVSKGIHMNRVLRLSASVRAWRRACGIAVASLLAALSAWGGDDIPARQQTPPPRVAIVFNGTAETHRTFLEAFLRGMNELGYANGHSVALDVRWAESRLDRLPAILSGVLERRPDVIVVAGSQAVRAARAATSSVPIVMASVGDPVAQGLIASLAHPGGNVTGIAIPSAVLMAKILEHLHELVPSASRIGVLTNPSNPVHAIAWRQTEAIARTRRVSLTRFEASGLRELERALAAIADQRPDALVVSADPLFNSFRRRIARFAAEKRIPAGYFSRDAVTEGGLMSYSPSIAEHHFVSARYVHRILKGARPHELPVEQPMDFELFVNVRTAKTLGITIPQAVIASAEELID
jgi:putative ABC transport system substrate-binding protein